MANLSDLTRKEQVLAYLEEHRNQWVDGPDLATEAVGGSEGLRRLRELRMEGTHHIRERRHPDPDRDIWQYMLVYVDHQSFGSVSKTYHAPLNLEPEEDHPYPTHDREAARREEEAQRLLDLPEPEPQESAWPADHDQVPISTAVKRKEDGTFEYVPPQRALTAPEPEPEPEATGIAFDSLPKKLVWGDMAVCPRCRGKTTRGRRPKAREPKSEQEVQRGIMARKKRSGEEVPLIDEDGVLLYRDPHSKKSRPCIRCNGYGIVPNVGAIPITMPDGPAKAKPGEEARPMELNLE